MPDPVWSPIRGCVAVPGRAGAAHFASMGRLLRFVVLLSAVFLVACAAPGVQVLDPASVHSQATPAAIAAANAARAPAANGAIYQPSSFRGLFEDRRARLVGDIVTIQIQEKTSARSSSNSSVDRNASVDASIGRLPFVSSTSSLIPKLGVAGGSSNSFEGKGATGSDNAFIGTITVTVVDVLPNGNLVVTGEKQVGINQNVEVLRFSGVVDPVSLMPGNVVSSTRVADARLEVRGRGDIDHAQTVGWLARFFLSFLPI